MIALRRLALAVTVLLAAVAWTAPSAEAADAWLRPRPAVRPASTPLTAIRHRTAWRDTAERAVAKAEAAAATHGSSPFVWAYLARAAANLDGWRHPRTTGYLRRVLVAQHVDGGWGIDRRSDPFGDGTWNDWGTSYTVTTADHVGPLLIDAYRAGVLPRGPIDRARESLLTTPRWETAEGACLAYSRSPNDLVVDATRCVNNANASAAWFLKANLDLGLTSDPAVRTLADRMMAYDAATLIAPVNRWPYSGVTPTLPQDLDHNSLNVEARILYDGGPTRSQLGGITLAAALAAPLTADYTDRLAWLRLAPHDPQNAWKWLEYGEWLLDNTPRAPTPTRPGWVPRETTIRYAQVALHASRSALTSL